MFIQTIDYTSKEYPPTLALRDRVMRQPLGLSIFEEDFSQEADALILGAYEEERLIGVGVLSVHESTGYMVDYLCIDTAIQSKGIGGKLLDALERLAAEQGAETVSLEARVSAQRFYERMGYQAFGEEYEMTVAPVPHIKMIKKLQ